jgi:(2Fe-2S) ferredoxin
VAIQARLKAKLKAAGLKESVRINKSGCLGQCGHGPMMVVYPEGVWYCHLGLEDVDRIWDEHIVGGRPVEELRYRTATAGTNVVPMRDPVARTPDPTSAFYQPCARCPALANSSP